jgi:hypothetical protein
MWTLVGIGALSYALTFALPASAEGPHVVHEETIAADLSAR